MSGECSNIFDSLGKYLINDSNSRQSNFPKPASPTPVVEMKEEPLDELAESVPMETCENTPEVTLDENIKEEPLDHDNSVVEVKEEKAPYIMIEDDDEGSDDDNTPLSKLRWLCNKEDFEAVNKIYAEISESFDKNLSVVSHRVHKKLPSMVNASFKQFVRREFNYANPYIQMKAAQLNYPPILSYSMSKNFSRSEVNNMILMPSGSKPVSTLNHNNQPSVPYVDIEPSHFTHTAQVESHFSVPVPSPKPSSPLKQQPSPSTSAQAQTQPTTALVAAPLNRLTINCKDNEKPVRASVRKLKHPLKVLENMTVDKMQTIMALSSCQLFNNPSSCSYPFFLYFPNGDSGLMIGDICRLLMQSKDQVKERISKKYKDALVRIHLTQNNHYLRLYDIRHEVSYNFTISNEIRTQLEATDSRIFVVLMDDDNDREYFQVLVRLNFHKKGTHKCNWMNRWATDAVVKEIEIMFMDPSETDFNKDQLQDYDMKQLREPVFTFVPPALSTLGGDLSRGVGVACHLFSVVFLRLFIAGCVPMNDLETLKKTVEHFLQYNKTQNSNHTKETIQVLMRTCHDALLPFFKTLKETYPLMITSSAGLKARYRLQQAELGDPNYVKEDTTLDKTRANLCTSFATAQENIARTLKLEYYPQMFTVIQQLNKLNGFITFLLLDWSYFGCFGSRGDMEHYTSKYCDGMSPVKRMASDFDQLKKKIALTQHQQPDSENTQRAMLAFKTCSTLAAFFLPNHFRKCLQTLQGQLNLILADLTKAKAALTTCWNRFCTQENNKLSHQVFLGTESLPNLLNSLQQMFDAIELWIRSVNTSVVLHYWRQMYQGLTLYNPSFKSNQYSVLMSGTNILELSIPFGSKNRTDKPALAVSYKPVEFPKVDELDDVEIKSEEPPAKYRILASEEKPSAPVPVPVSIINSVSGVENKLARRQTIVVIPSSTDKIPFVPSPSCSQAT